MHGREEPPAQPPRLPNLSVIHWRGVTPRQMCNRKSPLVWRRRSPYLPTIALREGLHHLLRTSSDAATGSAAELRGFTVEVSESKFSCRSAVRSSAWLGR